MRLILRLMGVVAGLLMSSAQIQAQSILFAGLSEGAVMLKNGAVVKGAIGLEPGGNKLVLQMSNDTTYTIPAASVRVFAVRGEQAPQKREQYVALTRIFRSFSYPWSTSKAPNLKMWGFFEQLSEGPIMLLRREQPVHYNNTVMNVNQRATTYSHTEIQTTFYLSTEEGELVTLHKPKRDLLSFFSKQAPQIKAYAKENDLDYKNARELAFLVNYANSLQPAQLQQDPLLPE